MSDYERFEAAQGDPWSTEPVGDYPRQPRESDPETYHDEAQVLARMPHVGDERSSDHYEHRSRGGHRRHRSSSARPGVPAPVWVFVGMGLVVLIAAPFFLGGKSGEETALDGPGWEEMPAMEASVAPTYSAGDSGSAWPQPSPYGQGVSPAATVTAEPTAPAAWPETDGLVGAPASAPYARNAAEFTAQVPGDRGNANFGADMSPYPSAAPISQTPGGAWDPRLSPSVATTPIAPSYQDTAAPSQPGYPMTANNPMTGWPDHTAGSGVSPSPSYEAASPVSNATSWEQGSQGPSLAAPQQETVMPGYGTYSAPQPNPYVTNPSGTAQDAPGNYLGTQRQATAQQYPGVAPNYPATGYPSSDTYLIPNYPQTAMSPRAVAPADSLPVGSMPAYPPQAVAPSSTYPPATVYPYNSQTVPTLPSNQPGYGSGVSTGTSQQSVARLNGTIQEPAARQAYDDRARPSYY